MEQLNLIPKHHERYHTIADPRMVLGNREIASNDMRTKKVTIDICRVCKIAIRELSPPSIYCTDCRKQLAEDYRTKLEKVKLTDYDFSVL